MLQHSKTITIEEISRMANVSIGTVDRAIHNRPGISSRTKEKILKITQTHGYSPNRLGRALARQKRLTLGVITIAEERNPYIQSMKIGIEKAYNEYRDFRMSLLVHSLKDFSAPEQSRLIYELLERGVEGMALVPVDSPEVREAINQAIDRGVPVVTFNSDLAGSKRICYVGQDSFRGGQVAADLLCKFMGGKGKLFVMHGSHNVASHEERLAGFRSVVKEEYPQVEIVAVKESQDDDEIAFEKTSAVLAHTPEVRGIYIAAAGVGGVGRAVKQAGRAGQVRIVCNDLTPDAIQLIRENVIDATIFQDPVTQGHLPVKILFELLFENIPPQQERYFTQLEVYTKHLL
jgi:LacI family transcriptional regulator